MVCVLDTTTGRSQPLHVGWSPVVSAGGDIVAVADYQGRLRWVEVASGKSTPMTLPGSHGPLIALPAADLAIYWALPTRGQPQRWTKSNSPLVGPKQMLAIKVGIANSNRFATLIPQIDPRHHVSYGSPGMRPPSHQSGAPAE